MSKNIAKVKILRGYPQQKLQEKLQEHVKFHEDKNNKRLSEQFQYMGKEQKALRVKTCNSYLSFLEMAKNEDFKYKLNKTNLCKIRFCSTCDTIRARDNAFTVLRITEMLKDTHAFLFLTLTIPNPKLQDLRVSALAMNRAFNHMMKLSSFKKTIKGFCVGLEFLGSKTPIGECHPHIHALLAVEKPYRPIDKHYIKANEIRAAWKSCCAAQGIYFESTPQVNIKRVFGKSINEQGDTDVGSAVFETSKYSIKHTDIEKIMNHGLFELLTVQAKGLQTFRLGGLFKNLKPQAIADIEQSKNAEFADYKVIRELHYRYCEQLKKYQLF